MSGSVSRKKSTDWAAPLDDVPAVEWRKLKMTPRRGDIGKTLLTLVILAPTSVSPMIGQAEVESMLPEKAYFADCLSGQPMNDSNGDNNNLPQLAHILADSYGNAIMHDTPNADLEAKDLLLESASIRFSSRMLSEITKGSCQPHQHADIGALPDLTCVLDDESVGLRGLSDMLSSAAYRLENLDKSTRAADGINGRRALVVARIGSLEHLYRMVFALSRIYLDRSQSDVYLKAAREQLRFARKHMEIERSLCACSDHEYTARLLELSDLEEQLKEIREEKKGGVDYKK